MDQNKVIFHNKDQREHEQLVQKNILKFCNKMLISAIEHDTSKWSEKEYLTFVESRQSLKQSKTGNEKEYQKYLKGEAIQHHIHNNPHHPEYWDAKGEKMPVHCVIEMFFDWFSRSQQNNKSMNGFWSYNIAKLKNQPHAIPIVEALKEEYVLNTKELI